MSFTKDLVEGFAQLLADAGIGLSWQSSGRYAAGEIGVFVAAVPPTPDRLVSLNPTPMSADPALTDSMFSLKVTCRGRVFDSDTGAGGPNDTFELDDAIQDVLLGNYPLTLSTGVKVETLGYVGGGSLGQDENLRWLWASRYQLIVYRPSPHRH